MHIFQHTNFDFLKWKWHAVALSLLIIIAGGVVIATKGIPLGIEFAGGTAVIAEFETTPSIEAVRSAMERNLAGSGENVVVQTYGDPAQRQVMVRVPTVGGESGTSLSKTAQTVIEALTRGNLGKFSVISTEIVGPAVGRELTSKGIYAFIASLFGILAYIAFRFQLSFAVGAVVATVHDVLVTFALLAIFQYDLTLNVIAAMLAVTGYSTNDTIVIFDRVRENLRSRRRESLTKVLNASLNQTLARTLITAGTAFLSALALFLFGGEVLHGFAFTMIVGIVTGTYSTVFVAGAIATMWKGREPKSVAAAALAEPAAQTGPAGKRAKPNRKARAS